MASYTELYSIFNDPTLGEKIQVACIVAAEAIRNEAPATENHSNRLVWAKKAFENPSAVRQQMLMALLAANKSMSVAELQAASDAAIQTAVNGAVNVFADGT